MDDSTEGLASIFSNAIDRDEKLSALPSSSSSYSEAISDALAAFKRCQEQIYKLSLFSANETLDDIATNDLRSVDHDRYHISQPLTKLRYLDTDYHVASLTSRLYSGNRKNNLQNSQSAYESYLRRLDNYEVLQDGESRMFERFLQSRNNFSVTEGADGAARRETKIRRFQEQKQLDAGLRHLRNKAQSRENNDDDEIIRKLRLAQIARNVHESFEGLESIAQELHILSLAPTESTQDQSRKQQDERERARQDDGFTERLDSLHMSSGLSGPLLDAKGKPMRPFTLLGKRDELRNGVFRPDHSLPTMSIDEYLEEERRRGGIIDGGGPQSGLKAEVDEDDMNRADQETMKARAWDEFTESNPKGSGNTLNRG